MKTSKATQKQIVEPVYLFMTAGGGSRNSDLIKRIYHTVVKTYRHAPTNPEKPTALLAISIGVAALNIHLMVQPLTQQQEYLKIQVMMSYLQLMSDQKRTQMRLPLCDLKLIVIEEISMVGDTTLLHIHQQLKDIWY